MLFGLCSYSQSLTVRNTSAYTITVGASEAVPTKCFDDSGAIATLAPNTSATIMSNGTTIYDWTVVRAGILGILGGPVPQVVSNSPCGTDCDTELSLLLSATWNGCYEVTIF